MPEKIRKQQSIEYGAIILLISTSLVKVIGAVFKIPLSNLIGDLGFGYFSSAYDLFTPIYSLAMAGLPIAVSRLVAENATTGRYRDVRQTLNNAKKAFFVTGFAGLVLMLALIYPFVHITDPTGETVYSLFAIAPSILLCCVMSTYRGYYEGLRNMYPTAASDIIEALGKLILGYGFAYIAMKLSNNVAYAAAAAMLGITVGALLAALYLRLRYQLKGDLITEAELAASPKPIDSKQAMRALIVIAIPVVLSSLANNIASLVDVSMVKWQLGRMIGEHADTLRSMYATSIADFNETSSHLLTDAGIPTFLYGIRGKAFTVYNLIPTITSVLGVSALPVLASSWMLKDKKKIKRNIDSMIKMTALIAMPAGAGFVALGGQIMGLLYKSVASVEIGGSMMQVFGFAAIFAGLSIPMTSMLQAIGKQIVPVKNIAVGAVIKIVVNYVLVGVPTINIKGAPIGTLACYLYIFIANLWALIKYTGVVPNILNVFIKPAAAALLCGLTAFGISLAGGSKMITVAAILAAAFVYLIALVALNAFEEEDFLSLPKGKKLAALCKKYKIIR